MGLAALALVALALLFLGGPEREFTTRSGEAYDLFERGYSQMIAFQFAQADSSLRRAVALDPGFAAAHALLSQLALRFGDQAGSDREAALADSLAARLPNALERAKLELLLLAYRKPGDQVRDSLLDYVLAEQPTDLMALSAKASVLYQTAAGTTASASTSRSWPSSPTTRPPTTCSATSPRGAATTSRPSPTCASTPSWRPGWPTPTTPWARC